MNTLTLRAAILAAALLAACPPAPCQWGSTPEDPLPICTAPGEQYPVSPVRLASGRYLVTWSDYRSGAMNPQAYYQLLDSHGVVLLQENGVQIFPGSTWITGVYFAIPDNQGGCIAIIQDYRNGAVDIYGQRFDSLGNRLWGEMGLPLILWPGTEDVSLSDAEMNNDGNIFLSWARQVSSSLNVTYVQKVSIQGQVLWGNYGSVETNTGDYDWQDIVPDGDEGVIDIWQLDNDTEFLQAQHLNAVGNIFWTPSGIPVLDPGGYQIQCSIMEIFPDGLGGGICVGARWGSGYTYSKIFRLNGQTGAVPWYHIWGVDNSYFTDAVQNPINHDVYALRTINPSPYQTRLHRFNVRGDHLWGESGLVISDLGFGSNLALTSDGMLLLASSHQATLFKVQRYDSLGQPLWVSGGEPLVNTPGGMTGPVVCSDGEDGLVAVWRDQTNWPNDDLYAARMRSDGSLGNVLPPPPYAPIYTQRQLSVRGNSLEFTLPQAGEIVLELYDLLGRKVQDLARGAYPAGATRLQLHTQELSSGLYVLRLNTQHGSHVTKLVILQ